MGTMSPIQEKLLEMLKWFHDYCEEEHLVYYIIGGTMLGAVRHQGFIPWDDDIDVGMPRKDYDKLLELMEGRINDHYTIESFYSGSLDYVYPFSKLYDTNTTLVEMKRISVKRGVFIDVFPLDGFGSGFAYRVKYKWFRLNKNTLSVLTADLNENRKGMTNMAVRICNLLPERIRIYMVKHLLMRIDHFCKLVPYETAEVVGNLVGSRKEREVMNKEFLGKPVLYSFENIKVFGVEKPDPYLKRLFRDYMKLPPENERRGHFTGYCDLNKSYLS